MARVRTTAACSVLCFALIAAGCSLSEPPDRAGGPSAAPTPSAVPSTNGGVAYAHIGEPATLDPAAAVVPAELLVADQVFDTLTTPGRGLTVAPAAAEWWEVDETATVFTFHLRRGARFHDGTEVTATSFVRSWERVANRQRSSPSPAHHLLERVVGIEQARTGGQLTGVVALDSHTLQVTLTEPYAEFPSVVTHPALSPLPATALEGTPDFHRMPVGNGPFRMSEPWQPGQFIRLEAAEGHPVRPRLAQVVLRIYEGDDASELAYDDFVRGNLDLAPVPDSRLREAISASGRARDGYTGPGVLDGATTTSVFYGFNVEVPPFDDPAVRQALAALADRDDLLAGPGAGQRVASTSIVLPGLAGYRPPPCATCGFDPSRATELLAERELEPIELVFYDTPEHRSIAERYRAAVNEALGDGALELRPLGQAEWLESVRSGAAGFFLSGWSPEYGAVGAYLQPLFDPARAGADNVFRYRADEVGELLEAARVTTDDRARGELYQQVEARVLSEAIVVPLYFYRHAQVASDRVEGLAVDPLGRVDLSRVSLVGGP